MKNYVIYFDIFGKKLKTTVRAKNVELAKNKVRNAVLFDSIVEDKDETVDFLKDVFGIK